MSISRIRKACPKCGSIDIRKIKSKSMFRCEKCFYTFKNPKVAERNCMV